MMNHRNVSILLSSVFNSWLLNSTDCLLTNTNTNTNTNTKDTAEKHPSLQHLQLATIYNGTPFIYSKARIYSGTQFTVRHHLVCQHLQYNTYSKPPFTVGHNLQWDTIYSKASCLFVHSISAPTYPVGGASSLIFTMIRKILHFYINTPHHQWL